MKIRLAEKQDLNNIVTLSICVWLDTYADDGVSDDMSQFVLSEFTVQKIGAKIKRQKIYVAAENLAILGVIILESDNNNKTEITNLYVLPKCQKKSLGRQLVQHVIDLYPNGLCVECWEHNTQALGFYRALGFVESGESVFELQGEQFRQIILSL